MIPRYFDIHTHVHFDAFKDDAQNVVERALKDGVWMIQVGTQKNTSQNAIAFAEKFEEGIYATVGLHPIHTDKSFHDREELGGNGSSFTSRGETFDANLYRQLAKHPKVVAIGECGLDYYRLSEETKEKQKKAFMEQIQLANDVGKPLMLHIRPAPCSLGEVGNAYKDAFEILRSEAKVKGNVHFFAGAWEEAQWFLNFGFTISFTGVITFTREYDEVVRNVPLDMVMSETDAPYVAPVPFRGKRNEPLYVKEIIQQIALVKNLPIKEVQEALVLNAKRVFSI